MRTKRLLLVWIGVAAIAGTVLEARADRIVLHEGKTLSGTILSENASEVTINLGQNMFLRIEKSKVREIIRTKKTRDVRENIIRLDSLTKSAAPAKPSRPAAGPAVKNPVEGSKTHESQKGGLKLTETIRCQTYGISGNTFDAVKTAILDPDTGKGFRTEYRREPAKTILENSWEGTSATDGGRAKWATVVIRATMTVVMPRWIAPKRPDAKSVEQWNAFLAEEETHNLGHVEIYDQALVSLGDTLIKLRAADAAALKKSSDDVVRRWKQQTALRQKGYDRRAAGREFSVPPKK